MSQEVIAALVGIGAVAFMAMAKAFFITPSEIAQLQRENAAKVLLLAELTKTAANDHDLLVRLDERVRASNGGGISHK